MNHHGMGRPNVNPVRNTGSTVAGTVGFIFVLIICAIIARSVYARSNPTPTEPHLLRPLPGGHL